jgi:hypothetical protein
VHLAVADRGAEGPQPVVELELVDLAWPRAARSPLAPAAGRSPPLRRGPRQSAQIVAGRGDSGAGRQPPYDNYTVSVAVEVLEDRGQVLRPRAVHVRTNHTRQALSPARSGAHTYQTQQQDGG